METKLINAVVNQLGYDSRKDLDLNLCGLGDCMATNSDLKGTLSDISNHGADSGWTGFTYTSDTVAFYHANKKAIVQAVKELADDIGEGSIQMVMGFNCLKGDVEEEEVGKVLYGRGNDDDDGERLVMNALAWFALEEVARYLVDR
jgi:hypothetical protein